MKNLLHLSLIIFFLISLPNCKGQTEAKENNTSRSIVKNKIVGGGCDGCELMFVKIPDKINPIDTSSAWNEKGQQLLVAGKVLKLDGKTPAPNVIVYYWQTDNNGYYSKTKEENTDHGHIRGWIKTGVNGEYSIYTIRPAPYPNADLPAHIHLSIKEPNIDDEYYTDNLVFDDDIKLTEAKRNQFKNRSGNGILKSVIVNEIQVAKHDIILGLNIPNYPRGNN